MNQTRYLTKSRFKLALECPTKLFYTGKESYTNGMDGNDFLAMLAEGGFQVGALAKALHPEGIEITERNPQKAIQATAPYLDRENVTLFEPAIQFGPYLVRVDILVKKGNHFDLIEVKAKSYNSLDTNLRGAKGGIIKGIRPYLEDVAFQKWVLQQAMPSATIRTFLMMPDKAKKAKIGGINQMFKLLPNKEIALRVPSDIDIHAIAQDLLYPLPVDEFTEEILSSPMQSPGGEQAFGEACQSWADAYQNNQKISPVIGTHCGQCEFKNNDDFSKSGFHECWKEANRWTDQDFKNHTVLDLWNSRRKQHFIESGRLKLTELNPSDVLKEDEDQDSDIHGLNRGQRQALQISYANQLTEDPFYFDHLLYQVTASEWQYPYHLIDFETSSVALPFHEGMRPYEAVAFQYSHHVMHQNGDVEHIGEFLSTTPGEFPNYAFARALKRELEQDNGSVFMWSPHENTILNSILRQLSEDPAPPEDTSDLIEFIISVTKGGEREMIDLCKLAEKAFFHPDTKGSNSIKKVLPAMLKISPKLKSLYSQSIYGDEHGIASKNFKNMAWLDSNGEGDPYAILKQYAKDLLPDGCQELEEGETSVIAEGGAATTAYSRLQFEDLNADSRSRIEQAMLRYCELDTLAMVMILQGWQDLVEERK